MKKKRLELEDIDSVSGSIRRFLNKKYTLFDMDSCQWWCSHRDSAFSIIHLLEKSGIYEQVVKDSLINSGHHKDEIKYILPMRAMEIEVKKTNLPRIVKPNKVNDNDLGDMIKDVVFGEGTVSKSDRLKETLTIAHNKKFRVSENCLKLLDIMYYLEEPNTLFENITLPFPSITEIHKITDEIISYTESPRISQLHLHVFENCKDFFAGHDMKFDLQTELLESSGVSVFENAITKKIADLREEKVKKLINRKYAKTTITIAELYKGLPLYIRNTLCIRMRLYTNEPYMSRTTGVFKSLLHEYKPIKLTINGLKHLLRAYYAPSPELTENFDKFFSKEKLSGKKGLRLMYDFFLKNPLIFSGIKKPLYAMNLHMEILKSRIDGKTSVNIEIDQTASGVMFLAYLLRSKKLAFVSNVSNKEEHCPYTYCMQKFEEFYDKEFEFKNDDFLSFVKSNRKLHKYALMCFCYEQLGPMFWGVAQKHVVKNTCKWHCIDSS